MSEHFNLFITLFTRDYWFRALPLLVNRVVVLEDVVDDSASWQEEEEGDETDDSASDTSSISDSLFDPSSETLSDRFLALKDIISPSTRLNLSESINKTKYYVKFIGKKLGFGAWVLTTTALLVGLPLVLSIEGEGALVAQEKEYLGQQVSLFFIPFFSSFLFSYFLLLNAIFRVRAGCLSMLGVNSWIERIDVLYLKLWKWIEV